jgi:hypothetical protein
LHGVSLADNQAFDPLPHVRCVRTGQLEELVDEPTDVGQHSHPLRYRRTFVVGERESAPSGVEAAGVGVEVAGAIVLDPGHGALSCNRRLHSHMPTLGRGS